MERFSFISLVLWLVLLVPGSAHAERLLASRADMKAVLSDDYKCGKTIPVTVRSSTDEAFTGERIELQRLLVGLRVVFGFECPEAENMIIDGEVAGKQVFKGAAAKDQDWLLIVLIEPQPNAISETTPSTTQIEAPASVATGTTANSTPQVAAVLPKPKQNATTETKPSTTQIEAPASVATGTTANSTPQVAAVLPKPKPEPKEDYCGPAGDKFLSFMVADELFGPFGDACQKHDECYTAAASKIIQSMETKYKMSVVSLDSLSDYKEEAKSLFESEKQICDGVFGGTLNTACLSDPDKALQKKLRPDEVVARCNNISAVYYAGVRSEWGQDAFDGAVENALQRPRQIASIDDKSTKEEEARAKLKQQEEVNKKTEVEDISAFPQEIMNKPGIYVFAIEDRKKYLPLKRWKLLKRNTDNQNQTAFRYYLGKEQDSTAWPTIRTNQKVAFVNTTRNNHVLLGYDRDNFRNIVDKTNKIDVTERKNENFTIISTPLNNSIGQGQYCFLESVKETSNVYIINELKDAHCFNLEKPLGEKLKSYEMIVDSEKLDDVFRTASLMATDRLIADSELGPKLYLADLGNSLRFTIHLPKNWDNIIKFDGNHDRKLDSEVDVSFYTDGSKWCSYFYKNRSSPKKCNEFVTRQTTKIQKENGYLTAIRNIPKKEITQFNGRIIFRTSFYNSKLNSKVFLDWIEYSKTDAQIMAETTKWAQKNQPKKAYASKVLTNDEATDVIENVWNNYCWGFPIGENIRLRDRSNYGRSDWLNKDIGRRFVLNTEMAGVLKAAHESGLIRMQYRPDKTRKTMGTVSISPSQTAEPLYMDRQSSLNDDFVCVRLGKFEITNILSNEYYSIEGAHHRVVMGTHLVELPKEFESFYRSLHYSAIPKEFEFLHRSLKDSHKQFAENRKFRIILKLDIFSKSWKIVASDVMEEDVEFTTNQVGKYLR